MAGGAPGPGPSGCEEGEDNLHSFRLWLKESGVEVNGEVVELREAKTESGQRHLSVYAAKDLDGSSNEVAARIPKSACLTRLTASCSERLATRSCRRP